MTQVSKYSIFIKGAFLSLVWITTLAYAAQEEAEDDEYFWGVSMNLSQKKCVPCTVGVPPLKGEELQRFFHQLDGTWKLIEEHHLEKEYTFKNFKEALHFVNRIGQLAEVEGHHPDIFLSWGKVKLLYWTHKIDGLSESDFIMAAKSDLCLR